MSIGSSGDEHPLEATYVVLIPKFGLQRRYHAHLATTSLSDSSYPFRMYRVNVRFVAFDPLTSKELADHDFKKTGINGARVKHGDMKPDTYERLVVWK